VATDLPAHREVAALLPPGAVRLIPVDAEPAGIAAAIMAARSDRLALDAAGGGDPRRWAVPSWDGMAGQVLETYRAVAPQVVPKTGPETDR
jgi:hypothetical protein